MTTLLEEAVDVARRLSPEKQDFLAQIILDLAADPAIAPEPIPAEHRAAVLEGLADIERGDFASDEDVTAIFRRLEG